MLNWCEKFDEEALKISKLDMGLKLLATVDEKERPHITLITFNEAKTPDEIIWGQFTEGRSKKNVLNNPKQCMFYMTPSMPFKFVIAKAEFVKKVKGGEDCEYFSRKPLLRYMTYANIHTVYYNKVVGVTPVRTLKVTKILKGIFLNLIGRKGKGLKFEGKPGNKLPDIGLEIFNGPVYARFMSYIDNDGYPVIIPLFGIRAPDRARLTFPAADYPGDPSELEKGKELAVFGIIPGTTTHPELVSLHVNGVFMGYSKKTGIKFGQIDITEVYNSMVPLAGTIYPELEIRPKVTDFENYPSDTPSG